MKQKIRKRKKKIKFWTEIEIQRLRYKESDDITTGFSLMSYNKFYN